MPQRIESAVDKIISDLRDRGGLGSMWDAIDADIQQEIRDTWVGIIEAEMEAP